MAQEPNLILLLSSQQESLNSLKSFTRAVALEASKKGLLLVSMSSRLLSSIKMALEMEGIMSHAAWMIKKSNGLLMMTVESRKFLKRERKMMWSMEIATFYSIGREKRNQKRMVVAQVMEVQVEIALRRKTKRRKRKAEVLWIETLKCSSCK